MNCQEMGHFKSKCTNPHVSEDGVDTGGDAGGIDNWGAQNANAGDTGGDVGGGEWGAPGW